MSPGNGAGPAHRARLLLAALPLALPVILSPPGRAQEATEPAVPYLQIPSIVVTANRVAEQPREVGSSVTVLAYDPGGRLSSVRDPAGHTTTRQYDALGRPVSMSASRRAGHRWRPASATTWRAAWSRSRTRGG